MTEKLLLDVNEVASLLGCGRTYVYGMIQRKELPVIKLGRLTRIPAGSLADVVARELARSEVDPSPWADSEPDQPRWAPQLASTADTGRRSRPREP
ncbi:MAG TPA: helix-turn-helix domain-containing protein [Candidatus Dormibacteraeota bacterium]|nr:helix-turn-helix domain-containing protein [Candidatus Dormibacteraeota bacterium]